MLEKWQRQPQRVGMVVGLVAMPLLSLLRANIFALFLFQHSLSLYLSPISLFYNALFGLVLGSGASISLAASHRSDFASAKRALLRSGSAVVGSIMLISMLSVWQNWPHPAPGTSFGPVTFGGVTFSWWAFPFFLHMVWANLWNLPLHLAILMLFIGLFMRSRR